MQAKSNFTFYQDVCRASDESLQNAGFRCCQLWFPCKDFVVYMKPVHADVSLYVMYRDCRSTGGNVSVVLWLAPVQIPDDRIDILGIGIKVIILSEFNVNDMIMAGATSKAISISESLGNFIAFVVSELSKPFVENRRTEIYRKALHIEQAITSVPDLKARLTCITNSYFDCSIDYDKVVFDCEVLIKAFNGKWQSELEHLKDSQKARLLAEIAVAKRLVI